MKPILRDAHLLASGSPAGPQPIEAPATHRTPASETAQDPAHSPIGSRQADILRLLGQHGGTATTAQLSKAGGLAPLAISADSEALAALGLVSLQQHPLLPNHATLMLTPLGRRVSEDFSSTTERARPRLAVIPGGRTSMDSA